MNKKYFNPSIGFFIISKIWNIKRKDEDLQPVGEIVIIKKDPTVLIANVITEMVCRDYPIPLIMDAVMLSKNILDEERKNSKKNKKEK